MSAPAFRLHLITLGVADIERAARFYQALGMKRHLRGANGVAFFDAGGVVLSLYSNDALTKDAGLENAAADFSGVTLAFNVESERAVDDALEAVWHAGGRILKPGYHVFWGGYVAYFCDPDEHVWEIAHNPQFPFDERGQIVLPQFHATSFRASRGRPQSKRAVDSF